MSVKSLLFVLGIVYLVAIATLANDQNSSKFRKVICIVPVHDEFFANCTCRARPVNRNTTVLNMRCNLHRQVDIITSSIQLYKKYNVYKPFLINVTENFCYYFSRKSSVPYTRLMMKIAAAYTNANHSCPYTGELLVTNAAFDARKLLDFWPSGEYRADVKLVINNSSSPSLTMEFFFDIEEKFFG